MNTEMQKIDIEKIMEEIRLEIKRKGYIEPEPNFQKIEKKVLKSTFNPNNFSEELYRANQLYENTYYFELGKGIKGVIKRGIRKAVAFLAIPILERQKNYNACVVRILNEMKCYMDMQEMQKKEMEEIIDALEEKVAILSKENSNR